MRKGMSQTLALIVAASVLMMTALTVIFMVTQGLGGVNEDKKIAECRGAIEPRCTANPGARITAPSVCQDDTGRAATGLASAINSPHNLQSNGQVLCAG